MMRVRRSGESHVSWGRSFLRRWVGCQLENGWLMVEKMWFCVGTQRVCYATPPAHSVDIVHRQSAINIIVHYQSYESRGIPRAILGLSTPCGISYRDEQQCDGLRIRDSPPCSPQPNLVPQQRKMCQAITPGTYQRPFGWCGGGGGGEQHGGGRTGNYRRGLDRSFRIREIRDG